MIDACFFVSLFFFFPSHTEAVFGGANREEGDCKVEVGHGISRLFNFNGCLYELAGGKKIVQDDYNLENTQTNKRGARTCIHVKMYNSTLKLGRVEEYEDGEFKGDLGEILIRCNNVLYVREAV